MTKPSSQSHGKVFWITGLSGSGKSTLAGKVRELLAETGVSTVLVDGDDVRELFGNDLGYGEEDRLKNAWRISRLCQFLASQGTTVVCATMSLFPDIWKWNRENIPSYHEIYLKTSSDTLKGRDPHGIYRRASQGTQQDVIGYDLPFYEPQNPSLVLLNDDCTPEVVKERAEHIIEHVMGSGS